MIALLRLLLALLTAPFKPMWRLEAENAALRKQLNILRRRMKARVHTEKLDTNVMKMQFTRQWRGLNPPMALDFS